MICLFLCDICSRIRGPGPGNGCLYCSETTSAYLSLSDVTQAEMFTDDVQCLTLDPVTFARVRRALCRAGTTWTLSATFEQQMIVITAAEVSSVFSPGRHFSLTVILPCRSS